MGAAFYSFLGGDGGWRIIPCCLMPGRVILASAGSAAGVRANGASDLSRSFLGLVTACARNLAGDVTVNAWGGHHYTVPCARIRR